METENEAAAEAPHDEANSAEPAKAEPAKTEPAKTEAHPPAAKAAARAPKTPAAAQLDDVFATVRRLEAFAADEAKRVSTKLVPGVEDHAKKHLWVSLLLSLCFGLILGIWLTRGHRRA